MIHKCFSMDPDLVARTCGFIGVLGSLVAVGVFDNPKFIITPQQNFESVILSLNVAAAEKIEPQEKTLEDHEPIQAAPKEVEPEKVETKEEPKSELKEEIKPEPTVKPKVEPKVEPKPESKPQPKPKAEPKPQPKTEPKPKVEPKPQPKREDQTSSTRHHTSVKPDTLAKPTTQPIPQASEQQSRKITAELSSLLVKEIKSKLRYPRNAVRRKLEGTVMVEFVIERGVVISYTINKSSGHKILDEAAGKLAKSMLKFNTKLSSMNNRVLIPIKYELI